MKKEYIKTIRKIAFILAIIIFTAVTIMLFPLFKNLSTKEGRLIAKEVLRNSGMLRWCFFSYARGA